jgi:hypothetical protein
MKLKLLIAIALVSMVCRAQSPINSYYPVNGAVYTVVSSSVPIDHTPSGESALWNFTNLSTIGTSTDNNLTPTPQEISTFPNSTTNTVTTTTIGPEQFESKIFSRENNGLISITGLLNSQVTLNFAANNANVGNFPANYGYSNADNLAGTFSSGAINGGLTGTINTSVDAYGTLNLNVDGTGDTAYNVTRLKSVISINLTLGILGVVGTIDQTLHYYYLNNGPNSPIFRASRTLANVPLQGINNEVFEQFEIYNPPLGLDQNTGVTDLISLVPNPTNELLFFQNKNQKIDQITVSDMSGRTVLERSSIDDFISMGHLQNGLYLVTIVADGKKTVIKIVKN